MENSLKQRIVGAVVLIALAVIFLPSILKEKTQREPFVSQIPAQPDHLKAEPPTTEETEQLVRAGDKLTKVKTETSKIPQPSDTSIETPEAIEQQNLITSEPASEPKKKPVVVKKPVEKSVDKPVSPELNQDSAWLIQVASFSTKENAVRLVEKLIAAGHAAYRKDAVINHQNKAVYRVFVGPFVEKNVAEKALASVIKTSETKAMLITFDPLKH